MTRSGGFRVALAALALSLTGYLVLVLVARQVTETDNAHFLLFWALLFGCYGILSGIAQESTRAATFSSRNNDDSRPFDSYDGKRTRFITSKKSESPPLLLANGFFFGLGLAVLLSATSPLWEPYFAFDRPFLINAFLMLSVVGFGCHSSILGAAAGKQAWNSYSLLLSGEGIMRLTAAGTVTLLALQLVSYEIAATLGGFTWIVVLIFSPQTREAARQRADVPAKTLRRNTVHAIVSSSSTALLVVGFPLLLRAASSAEVYAQSAALLLAVSVTRAPLMLPLAAFQNILVSYFVRTSALNDTTKGLGGGGSDRHSAKIDFSRLFKPFSALLALGCVAAAAAWFLGPPIMLIFGSSYIVDSWVMAALTFAGSLIAALTLTGAATLAVNKHSACSAGWIIAAATSMFLLFYFRDAGLDLRIVISLIVGPLAGCVIHLCTLLPVRLFLSPDDTD